MRSGIAECLERQAFFKYSEFSGEPAQISLAKAACFGVPLRQSDKSAFKNEMIYEFIQPQLPLQGDSHPSDTDDPLTDNYNHTDNNTQSDSAQSDMPENTALHPIIETDISADDLFVLNSTVKSDPDTRKLYEQKLPEAKIDKDKPLVLVLHTHATECYSREGSDFYDENAATRTVDENINMIAVGNTFCETLEELGIPTLHCKTQHDAHSYRDSYSLAAESIRECLKENPSIRYVFDLHRDAILYANKAKARPSVETDGKKAAQIMILVGTDEGGADFPNWENNLSLALKLAVTLDGNHPNLVRPIALRGASYNEQYSDGSLLVEIGSDGNTLEEAKYSAKLLAESFAEVILQAQ